jgi:hypothetical protein
MQYISESLLSFVLSHSFIHVRFSVQVDVGGTRDSSMHSTDTEYSPHNSCHNTLQNRVFTTKRPNLCTTIPNKVIRHSFRQDSLCFILAFVTLDVRTGKCMILKVKYVGNKQHCGKINNLRYLNFRVMHPV